MPEKDIKDQLENMFSDISIPKPQPHLTPATPRLQGSPAEPSSVESESEVTAGQGHRRRVEGGRTAWQRAFKRRRGEERSDRPMTGQIFKSFNPPEPADLSRRQERRGGLARQLRRFFLALTLVPLFAAGLISVGSARVALEREVSRSQTIAATEASLIVSAYVQNLADGLALFAQARDMGNQKDIALLDALRSLFNQFPRTLEQITFLDTSGRQVAQGTPFLTTLTSKSVSWAGTDVFAAASTGQTYIASQPAPESDVLSVTTIGVPVYDHRGEIAGVLVATPNPRQMWREVSQVEVGQSGYAYAIDRHGNLVAYHELEQPVSPDRLAQLVSVRAFVDETTPSARAVGVYEGLMGQSVIGAYAPVAGTPWAVVVELPTKEALSALRPLTLFLVILFALAAILAVGAGSALADRVAEPVLRLRDNALALGQGDLDRAIEIHTGDEIEELGDAFNRMAQSLRASRAEREAWTRELESQVADRTRELQEMVDRQGFLLRTIWELAVPVVPVMKGVIVLPLVGFLDAARGRQVVESLMEGLKTHNARFVILDITGVPKVDEEVAGYLLRATRSARLLGAEPILVGVTPAVAQSLVGLGADLGRIVTRADLQAGVEYTRQALRRQPFG